MVCVSAGSLVHCEKGSLRRTWRWPEAEERGVQQGQQNQNAFNQVILPSRASGEVHTHP